MNVKKFLSLSTAVAAMAVIGASQAHALSGLNSEFDATSLTIGTDGSGNFSITGMGNLVNDITNTTTTGVSLSLTAPYMDAVSISSAGGFTVAEVDLGALSVSLSKSGTLIAGSSNSGNFFSFNTSGNVYFDPGTTAITVPSGLKDASITDSLNITSPISDRGDGKFANFTAGSGSVFYFQANPVPEFSSVLGMGSLLVGGGLLGLRRRTRA
jgi:hypothetical protein